MKLVFATANKGKLREAAEILGSYEIVSPAEMGFTDDVEETGSTFKENSEIKAVATSEALGGIDCFADDSGLEVDALDGAPGIYSARYASLAGEGADHNFSDNIDRLLKELEARPGASRRARFRCVVTLLYKGEKVFFDGTCEGRIALGRAGCGGFGYDPVFVPDASPEGLTMAEMGEEFKNSISHRFKALTKMAHWLSERENG